MSRVSRCRLRSAASATGLALILATSQPASALELVFPSAAERTASRSERLSSIRLPIGPFAAGNLPMRLTEGALEIASFRMGLEGSSTLELMLGLRDQIEAAGFEVNFECETEACGGYDFRYGTTLLPEPDMHVNLGDFRYLKAQGQDGQTVALMVSRAGQVGFVQLTQVIPQGVASAGINSRPAPVAEAIAAPPLPQSAGLVSELEVGRAVVLEDLVFPSGSSSLTQADYSSLAELAVWLAANPARRVVLVGHTDASGALEGNITLSKARAESVRQALLALQNISTLQVQAEGVGYLAPRHSNLTEDGRRKNRRVEVMMTSTALPAP